MSYGNYLKNLLRPLGLYRLENSVNGAELETYGTQLDGCETHLDTTQREQLPISAEEIGLERFQALLKYRPIGKSTAELQQILPQLLYPVNTPSTLEQINQTIQSYGIEAQVQETAQKYVVEVRFPHLAKHLDILDFMRRIVADILPCHLKVIWQNSDVEWSVLSNGTHIWSDFDNGTNTWQQIMVYSDD